MTLSWVAKCGKKYSLTAKTNNVDNKLRLKSLYIIKEQDDFQRTFSF